MESDRCSKDPVPPVLPHWHPIFDFMPKTDDSVLKCLRAIENLADANLFFDLLTQLIRELNLSESDERLALNVRIDKSPKELLAGIGSRKVLLFLPEGTISWLAFAVYEKDFYVLQESISGLTQLGAPFAKESRRVSTPALVCRISLPDFQSQPQEPLLKAWLQHSRDYLLKQKSSSFRKHHLPLLYEMALDKTRREQVFEEVKQSPFPSNSPFQPTPEQKFQALIYNYERLLGADSNEPERYKWTCVAHFQKVWDTEAGDFGAMLKEALRKSENLLYHNSSNFILKMAALEPEQVRPLFRDLYKEEPALGVRIALFQKGMTLLQKKQQEATAKKWTHQQDERTISFYLAMRFPEKYPLYKASVYEFLIEFFPGEAKKKTGQRFLHFMELGQQLLPLISGNAGLKNRVAQTLQADDWQGPQDWLLFQDVLYRNRRSPPPAGMLSEPENPAYARNNRNGIMGIPAPPMPLNTILYGPPGTGKTYATLEKAVAFAEPHFVPAGPTEAEMRESYREQYEALVQEGRIRFVTFHQSFSYEDFIEGIKPVTEEENGGTLRYEVRLGLFRKIALDAAFSFIQQQTSVAYYNHFLAFNERYNDFLSQVRAALENGEPFSLETKTGQKLNIKDLSDKDNLVITHGESTKTYIISKSRLALLAEAYPDVRDMKNIDREVRAVIGGANGSAFWSVLHFIQRNTKGIETRELLVAEPKRQFSEEDKRAAVNDINWSATGPAVPQKSFVLIIDEINRGNISQIFGELITLLEEDKRAGGKEALTLRLPYSGDSFSVPSNLYIIGTMNTADRSVEALDTALRRRFSFVEMAPREDLLQGKTVEVAGKSYDLGQLLHTLNARMELLAGRDHRIGHSYFMNAAAEGWKGLKTVFERNIIPLLQEYFWNDYPRMELVLGAGFVSIAPAQKVQFAKTSSARAADIKAALVEKETGQLQDWNKATDTEQQFGAALDMLLFPATENNADAEI